MKKNNPLFGFWRSNSTSLSQIEKIMTGTRAVMSKYNKRTSGARTTAIYSLLKAILLTVGNDSTTEFFVGKTKDGKFIAELASASRPDMVSVALYDPSSGAVKASGIDRISHNMKPYYVAEASSDGVDDEDFFVSDGTVIWLAVLPEILNDTEAQVEALKFVGLFGDPAVAKMEGANRAAGTLSDNVYIRTTMEDETSKAHIKLYNQPQPGRLLINQINSMNNSVCEKLYGNPIITGISSHTVRKIKEGEFNLGVKLNAEQKKHLRDLPEGHVTSRTELRMLEVIKRTYGTSHPVQNLLLEGPPGTGKSRSALAVAHYLGLPYYTFVCSDGTTEDDILGCILPVPKGNDSIQLKNIPSSLELEFEPEDSYEKLTGSRPSKVRPDDLPVENLRLANNALRKMVETGSAESSISYDYFPSTIITAFRDGGVIEIQEPSAIASASVLSCLNDVMNSSDGTINTPYGSIKRHPNCFVIATTNPDTNGGYGKLNEAVRNRFQRTYKVELPTIDEMVKRAMNMNLIKDESKCHAMAEAIQFIDTAIKENGIQGQAGMRCFYEWCQDVDAGENMKDALAECVINNITTNDDEQELLYDIVSTNTTLLS